MAITFHNNGISLKLDNKRKLSSFIKELITQHLGCKDKINIHFIFCNDSFLLDINRKFLNHDTYTDIITFDLSESSQELSSEIYISIERVTENAIKFNANFEKELHRVIFHGVLHLCGFKDKSKTHKLKMTEQENKCLETYFNNKLNN